MAFERLAAIVAQVAALAASKPDSRKGFAVEDSDGHVRVQVGGDVWTVTDPTGRVRSGDPVIVTEAGNSGLVTANLREAGAGWWEAAPATLCLPWLGAVSPSEYWILAQGQAINSSTDPLCAAAFGSYFPDPRNRHLLGASSSRSVRSTGGSATITTAQMPAHDHSVGNQASNVAASGTAIGEELLGASTSRGWRTGSTGGGQEYWAPYLAINLIIRRG